MTVARRPSPFGELVSLRQAMDRLFEDSFVRPTRWLTTGSADLPSGLPLDVHITDAVLVVQAQLPGVRPEDVDVTVENGTLTIAGTISSETESESEERSFLVREIRRGSISRTITLPDGLEPDRATADFENGVLVLRIPRAEQVKPRTIRITPTVAGHATEASPADATSTLPAAGATSGSTPTESGNEHQHSDGETVA